MRKKYIYYAILAVVLIISGTLLLNSKKTISETISVGYGDFVNQVSVSGKVVPSEEVKLAFEKGGKIEGIYYKVGQALKAGRAIAKIDAKDAEKAVSDAQISLEGSKLSLAKLKLENSEESMSADLSKAYDDGFTAVSDAFIDLSTIITGLEDILSEENISTTYMRNSDTILLAYSKEANKLYYQSLSAFKENRKNFRLLNRNSSTVEVEAIIDKTYETTKLFSNAIKSIRNVIDYLADDTNDASDFASSQATLSEYASMTNEHLAKLVDIKTDIRNFKNSFSSTEIDIEDLELTIKQKGNSLIDAQKQLSDYYIYAPFSGAITKIDAKVGEIASAGAPLITIMSEDTFQVESYVPEIHIALIKLGDSAKITLDAYGENVFFESNVVSVDPAETLRDGVSTYKIKLQFTEKDERIKSGMTANVSIIIFNKSNVIVVPGGTVFEKEGKNFVQVKTENGVKDREVTLGSVSVLGQVEIVSGKNSCHP